MEVSAVPEFKRSDKSSVRKGGLRTMPFILASDTFERVATSGLSANMIRYLIREFNMSIPVGGYVLFIWTSITNFTPLFGAFLSDSYLGRFRSIIFGSIISLLGMILLWSTTMIPGMQPEGNKSASSSQLALLFCSFILMSIGTGGVRPCCLAFGADQLAPQENQKKSTVLHFYFSWYYALMGVSVMFVTTVIVYIQEYMGWKAGLGLPACLWLLSTVMFAVGSPFYIKIKAKKRLFTGLGQVMVAAFRKRHIDLGSKDKEGCQYHSGGSYLDAPTDKLRFLNKACIIINPQKDLNTEGSASNPWNLCTVEQVEELKSLIRLLPIWSTGILVALNQNQFIVVQANTMDRHLGPHFEIPGGSLNVFSVITLMTWVAIYDRLIVPLLRKVTGRPRGLSLKQRMGIGLLLSIVAIGYLAFIESVRRGRALRQGLSENWKAQVDMTAMWLVPVYVLAGLAEAFTAIGQIEFYYSELPHSMSSLVAALASLAYGIGHLIGAGLVKIVDEVSKKGGRESWVANNLNKGRYDRYYWILTVLVSINFLYFLFCSRAYGPCKIEVETVSKDEEDKEKDRIQV